ncbi:hypothetical protein [Altererythrobacter ishigakiensis]|uniref:Uncharacterized protein n=1 Tax=Altererythrobacter ishigakiensis TaxID=476157 RepID=A0A562USN9_9SPHN|nr:hypothetical protein [Altererythrobacter ishigakiensis]TWJ08621.1 hypothetical protein JN10_0236 [Altererythrobacter ishigakiensis]
MENEFEDRENDLYVPDEREDIEGHACKALNLSNQHRGRHHLNLVKEAMPANALMCCREPLAKESTVAAYEAFDPQDEQERILCSQMVIMHDHVMDCLMRANEPHIDPRLRPEELKHAERLGGLTVRLSEALDKHRGKGQQTVTVEHVCVGEGGQAIVGNVETSGRTQAESRPDRFEYQPDDFVPIDIPDKVQMRQQTRDEERA